MSFEVVITKKLGSVRKKNGKFPAKMKLLTATTYSRFSVHFEFLVYVCSSYTIFSDFLNDCNHTKPKQFNIILYVLHRNKLLTASSYSFVSVLLSTSLLCMFIIHVLLCECKHITPLNTTPIHYIIYVMNEFFIHYDNVKTGRSSLSQFCC